MIGCGNILQHLGLSGCPCGLEGSSVSGLALFGAGGILSLLGGDHCGCSLVMSCVVAADMGCGAGLTVCAPTVADAPVVIGCGNSNCFTADLCIAGSTVDNLVIAAISGASGIDLILNNRLTC